MADPAPAARGGSGRGARRPWALAALIVVAAIGIGACSSGLPPDNEVRFEDIPLSSLPQPATEPPLGRPEPGLSPLAVTNGFMRAMSALDAEVASLWVAGNAKARISGWGDTKAIDVYARRSVIEWSEESGGAEVVIGLQRQGQLVGGTSWHPTSGGDEQVIRLIRDGGEWRVANPPAVPLVAGSDFARRFARAAVYFVARDGDHLSPDPVLLRVPATDPGRDRAGGQVVDSARALIEQLLLGPRGESEGTLQTSIPPGARLRGVRVIDRVAAVDLSAEFARPTGASGRLRVGQVVWTVGQLFGVPQVELLIDGEPAGPIGPDRFDASGRWTPTKPPLDGLLPSRRGSAEALLYTRDGQLTRLSIAGGDPAVVPVAPVGIVKSPTLSPDGSRIAFVIRGGATDTIWFSSPDGRQSMRDPVLSGRLSDPSWTPDGEQVLVLRGGEVDPGRPAEGGHGRRTTLWSVRPPGQGRRVSQLRLAPMPGGLEPTTLRVSPDGAFVLAVGAPPGPAFRFGGGGQLFRGRLTDDGVSRWFATSVAPGFRTVFSPVWAGVDKIAFIAKQGVQDDQGSIWVMDQDGWRPERVDLGSDRNLNLGERLAADPKGDRFVFTVHAESGATELYTMLRVDVAGSLRGLTRGGVEETDPALASR